MDREAIARAMTAVELAPAAVDRELTMRTYSKLPLSRIAALGVGLEPVMAALQQLTSHGQAASGYYKVTLPAGTHLAQFTNSSDFLGTALANGNNTIAGQAHLTPILCNPTMLFITTNSTGMMKNINRPTTGRFWQCAGRLGRKSTFAGNRSTKD